MAIRMKAGTYYIGDPCYVIHDDNWMGFLDLMYEVDDNEFQYKGFTCWVGSTAFGDGIYFDNFDNNYPVDAGLIGIVPVGAVEDKTGLEHGNIAVFSEDFTIDYHCGYFNIGGVEINTDDEDEDDEDEWY
ncbi:MAG: hypothetical protein CMF22_10180 [Idiomarinaceae bacterium]|nr:hypothetical protein [Idiomarinaceae bacterium]MBG23809.1 hypothetical protein [Idiomarinaceae bacterium]